MTNRDEPTKRPAILFGRFLAKVLKRSKVERKKLAMDLDVGVTMISHYCRGKLVPTRRAMQIILHRIPRSLRQPLCERYFFFDFEPRFDRLCEQPQEALLEQIQEDIEDGGTLYAFELAITLLKETLDPDFAQALEDIIFELHLRMGQWGAAALFADSVVVRAASELADRDTALMRAACMRAIAFRSMGKYGAAGSQLRTLLNMDLSATSRFDSMRTTFGTYAEILRREHVLTSIGGTKSDERMLAAKNEVKQVEKWLDQIMTPQGEWLLLETAGQCHLALRDSGGVEDILDELRPKISLCRTNMERYHLLEGRWLALEGEWATALESFQLAYHKATEMGNLHHANVAQRWIGHAVAAVC